MAWLLGHSDISFTHHKEPVTVRRGSKRSSLLSICEEATPPCRLNPLLFNGHLQTMWTAMKSTDIPVYYKRAIFTADLPEYAGTFAVDFAVAPYDAERDQSLPERTSHLTDKEFEALGSDDDKPMLICLHGLSGGSYEIYLRAVLKPLLDAGWEAAVVNSRGCAESKVTSGILYNARATWDARQFIRWARLKWPHRKLFGIGFSLGANMMVNYLGEEGDQCVLTAAVVCSNPWNLDVTNMALRSTWLGLEVYSKTMGNNLKNLFTKHIDSLSKNSRLDIDKVLSIKYLHEFDREVQCPSWGYPTEGAYYRDAGSVDSINAIRTPMFAINAEDDPIAHKTGLPWEEIRQNPYCVMCTTSWGGHLSWFETGGGRWFAKPAANFLVKMAASDVEVGKLEMPKAVEPSDRKAIADRPTTFFTMRRKLKMPMDI